MAINHKQQFRPVYVKMFGPLILLFLIQIADLAAQTPFILPGEYDKFLTVEDTVMLTDPVSGQRYAIECRTLARANELELYSIEHAGRFPQVNLDSAGILVPRRRLNNELQRIFLQGSGFLDDFGGYLETEAAAMENADRNETAGDNQADINIRNTEEDEPVYHVNETGFLEYQFINMAHNVLTVSEEYSYFHSVYSETAPGSRGARNTLRIHALDLVGGTKLRWTDLFKPGHSAAVRQWLLDYPPVSQIKQRGSVLLDSTDVPNFSVGPTALHLMLRICYDGDCPDEFNPNAPLDEYHYENVIVPLVLLREHLNTAIFSPNYTQAGEQIDSKFPPQTSAVLPFPLSLLMLDATSWVSQFSEVKYLLAQLQDYLAEPGIKSVRVQTPEGIDTLSVDFDRNGRISRLSVRMIAQHYRPRRYWRRDLNIVYRDSGDTEFTLVNAEGKDDWPQEGGVPIGWARQYTTLPLFVANVNLSNQVVIRLDNGTILHTIYGNPTTRYSNQLIRRKLDETGLVMTDSVFNTFGIELDRVVDYHRRDPALMLAVEHTEGRRPDTLMRVEILGSEDIGSMNGYFAGRQSERRSYFFDYRDDGVITVVRSGPQAKDDNPPLVSFEYDYIGRLLSINKRLRVVYDYW